MKYDFESIIDREGKDAIAVDAKQKQPLDGFDYIPMWIADMNFATAPSIQKEIIGRVQHPCFGYFDPRKEYFDAIKYWQNTNNHVTNLEIENIGYENGVLGGVASALKVLCSPGGKVLVHTPVYIGFRHVLESDGYNPVYSNLIRDEEGVWRMDYKDMEEKIVNENIHVAILCSPHNPTGRVWEKEELEKAMELFKKYDVDVISDEIWSDLLLNGNVHIPTQSISPDAKQRTIAFYAPSKTFSLAGLIGSYRIVYNKKLNDRIAAFEKTSHYNHLNILSQYALIGAYSQEGQDWKNQLNEVLSDNVNYAYNFIKNNLDGVDLCKPQGTYMLFLDCGQYCKKHNITLQQLLDRGWDYGVGWQDGSSFLLDNAIRMNLALPHSKVIEAFDRLLKYVFVY